VIGSGVGSPCARVIANPAMRAQKTATRRSWVAVF